MHGVRLALAWLVLTGAGLPSLAAPPPARAFKGQIESLNAAQGTLTVRAESGRTETFAVRDSVLRARLRELRPGDLVTVSFQPGPPPIATRIEVQSRAPGPRSPEATPASAAQRLTRVLLSSDVACALRVDFKDAGTLAAGTARTLELAPGEHLLQAVTPDGREWQDKLKVGSDQLVVQIKLAGASPAQFDRAAAAVWLALADVRLSGEAFATAVRPSFGFHDPALSSGPHRSRAELQRAASALKELPPPDGTRERGRRELERAGAAAEKYVELLARAASLAQDKGVWRGEPADLHAQAQALEPALQPAGDAVAWLRESNDALDSVPPDWRPALGLAPDARDVGLGARDCHSSPGVLALVQKGTLAERIGLKPRDRLVSAGGRPLSSVWDLKLALREHAGGKLGVEFERAGKRQRREIAVPSPLP